MVSTGLDCLVVTEACRKANDIKGVGGSRCKHAGGGRAIPSPKKSSKPWNLLTFSPRVASYIYR